MKLNKPLISVILLKNTQLLLNFKKSFEKINYLEQQCQKRDYFKFWFFIKLNKIILL